MNIDLEYRISKGHIGQIEAPNLITQSYNEWWSYARHLPADWDLSKIEKRTRVISELLQNLKNMKGDEIDLSPLRNDQRASGFVYGTNPLQDAYDLIAEYAERFPEHEFFGKFGGYKPHIPGKRIVFYVEDERDASLLSDRINLLSKEMEINMSVSHQYGLATYQRFVNIDAKLKPVVKDKSMFRKHLQELVRFPHFFHDLFF